MKSILMSIFVLILSSQVSASCDFDVDFRDAYNPRSTDAEGVSWVGVLRESELLEILGQQLEKKGYRVSTADSRGNSEILSIGLITGMPDGHILGASSKILNTEYSDFSELGLHTLIFSSREQARRAYRKTMKRLVAQLPECTTKP